MSVALWLGLSYHFLECCHPGRGRKKNKTKFWADNAAFRLTRRVSDDVFRPIFCEIFGLAEDCVTAAKWWVSEKGKFWKICKSAFQQRQLRGGNLKSSTIWVWRYGNRDSSHAKLLIDFAHRFIINSTSTQANFFTLHTRKLLVC
jgi:hypothetical protein